MFVIQMRKEYEIVGGLKRHYVAYYLGGELQCKNYWPSRPNKRNKYSNYNCVKYKIEWLEDMK